jgi:hypothetical protein
MGESAAWKGAALEHAEALALFLSARVWPHISLNRRLPRTTQRAVCLLVHEIDYSTDRRPKHRAGNFSGAACLTRCFGLPRPGKNMRSSSAHATAAPVQHPRLYLLRYARPGGIGDEIVRIRELKSARIVKMPHVLFRKSPSTRAKIGF